MPSLASSTPAARGRRRRWRPLLLGSVQSLPVGLLHELREVRALVGGAQGVAGVHAAILRLLLVLRLTDLRLRNVHLLARLDVVELDSHAVRLHRLPDGIAEKTPFGAE